MAFSKNKNYFLTISFFLILFAFHKAASCQALLLPRTSAKPGLCTAGSRQSAAEVLEEQPVGAELEPALGRDKHSRGPLTPLLPGVFARPTSPFSRICY